MKLTHIKGIPGIFGVHTVPNPLSDYLLLPYDNGTPTMHRILIGNIRNVGLVSLINKKKTMTTIVEK